MKEKTILEEEERVKEIESLRQKHAETVNEIDQMFVRILYSFRVVLVGVSGLVVRVSNL